MQPKRYIFVIHIKPIIINISTGWPQDKEQIWKEVNLFLPALGFGLQVPPKARTTFISLLLDILSNISNLIVNEDIFLFCFALNPVLNAQYLPVM